MDFKVRSEDFVGDDWRISSDIDIEPGQILLAPRSNRLYEPSINPLDNSKTWPPWRRDANGGFKACQGTSDYLSLGGTFRLPAPVQFRPNPRGDDWEARWDVGSYAEERDPWGPLLAMDHFPYDASGEACPMNQGRALPQSAQIKLVNPWQIKTAPGWSTILLPCIYEGRHNWALLPGIVNTDYYHHMNWVINIYSNEPFTLPVGTPIGQFFTYPRDYQQVLFADEKIANLLTNKGMQSPIGIPGDRKGLYRSHQKETPKAPICPVSRPRIPLWKRGYRWLFGEFNAPKERG